MGTGRTQLGNFVYGGGGEMRTWLAFMKKEWTYQVRTGKLFVLGLLFAAFGIMNPAVAKLTPWLMELFSESFAQSGINVSQITVTAMDSWVQFFKNIPMALIVFVILQGGIFAKEYQSGTLVLALTKGLQRYKVVISKALMLVLLWSVGCVLVSRMRTMRIFGITAWCKIWAFPHFVGGCSGCG